MPGGVAALWLCREWWVVLGPLDGVAGVGLTVRAGTTGEPV